MKSPLIRIASRGLAAQAAANPAGRQASEFPTPINGVASNKVAYTAVENNGGLSRVSIIFRTGSRNETPENRGVAAVIRSYVGLATQKFSYFGIIRNVQQAGAYLYASGDRETTAFTLVATRDHIESVLPYLSQVACSPAFKPWELSDNLHFLKYQVAILTPQARVVDILHKAAYRTGLGNSIFIKKDHLGKHDSETLKHFVAQGFTANRAIVAAVNVDPIIVNEYTGSLSLETGDPVNGNGVYLGGQIRKEKYGKSSVVAVAAEGAGWVKDPKSAAALSVLKCALGVAPSCPWGTGVSPIAKSVAAATQDNAGASAFNISYSDSGLFGVLVSSSSDVAGKAVEAAVKVLRSGNVSDADVARGKAIARAEVLDKLDNGGTLLENIALQAVFTGSAPSGAALIDAIDKVSASEVKAVAKKVASGNLSLAGFGNLDNVPYLDQLK